MEADDWLRSIEKKLEIAQCTNQEKVLFVAHQLFGTAAEWWEMYCNSHQDIGAITWNEFKARFRTHYVPRGTLKLKNKEFSELQQDRMTVNEYLNKFTQISRYAPDEVNTDEKKQDAFLNGLNDEIQFQLLNIDYEDFQKMVDKAIIVKNKIKEMEKNGKRKTSFSGQLSGSNT
jgi:predicted PolB exonuclease-like 3'-5' exonuclease